MVFIMVFVYMLNGQPMLEKGSFGTVGECQAAGVAAQEKAEARGGDTLLGVCVGQPATEVQK